MLNEFVLNGEKYSVIGSTYRKNGSFIKKQEWLYALDQYEKSEKVKTFSKVSIQSSGNEYKVPSSETLVRKNVASGKWEVKVLKPFQRDRKFYIFNTLKMVRSFLNRHNLMKEHESFSKLRIEK